MFGLCFSRGVCSPYFEYILARNPRRPGIPPPPPGTPGPFALTQDGKVEAICKSVGLKVLEKQNVPCPWHFAGVEELQKGFMCTGPCVKAAEVVGEDKVKAAIRKSAEPFVLADGLYRMRNQFTFFITERT